jgi:hypothetical protein
MVGFPSQHKLQSKRLGVILVGYNCLSECADRQLLQVGQTSSPGTVTFGRNQPPGLRGINCLWAGMPSQTPPILEAGIDFAAS